MIAGSPSATIWLLDGRAVADEQLAAFVALLCTAEAQRHCRFLRAQRRRQFLLGRMLLRFALNSRFGIPIQAIGTIERDGLGPQLLLPDDAPRLHFSLSHSREWVACAIGPDHALGIDIEAIDGRRDILAISAASFHEDEHAWLLGQADADRINAFYRLWTLQEALYKLQSNRGAPMHPRIVSAYNGHLLCEGETWFSRCLEHPGVAITLCSEHHLQQVDLVRVTQLGSLDAASP